jgi:hypothetical protein
MAITEKFALDSLRGEEYRRLKRLYELFSTSLIVDYGPYKADGLTSERSFSQRISPWIEAFESDDDQWVAFRVLQYVMYLGLREFHELYRVASSKSIVPWLLKQGGIGLLSVDAQERLDAACGATWCCPLTDSMNINDFLGRTGLPKSSHPQLEPMSDVQFEEGIVKKIKDSSIRYFVLIEDFVGSGKQAVETVKRLGDRLEIPFLVLPLVTCSDGFKKLTQLEKTYPLMTFDTALLIDENCLIRQSVVPDAPIEPPTFDEFRQLIRKINRAGPGEKLWGYPYGVGGVGVLATKHQNSPNNMHPIFHEKNGVVHHPIFPRSAKRQNQKRKKVES